jgi:quinol monooxygenase YgiN
VHIQVVNFHLKDLSHEDFAKQCDELAATFAAVPGLLSKVWLSDTATNTYGGIYAWRDRQAMEAYLTSDLFHAVATNPHFADISSKDFDILESPTRVTRGLQEALV